MSFFVYTTSVTLESNKFHQLMQCVRPLVGMMYVYTKYESHKN